MDIDRMLDHLESRYHLSPVLRMGQAGIREVEGGIYLGLAHRREGRIDYDDLSTDMLQNPIGVHPVRFFLDMAEVLRLFELVAQAFFVGEEDNIVSLLFYMTCKVGRLGNIFQSRKRCAIFQAAHQFLQGQLAHTIY